MPAKPNIPVWVCDRERAVSGMTMVVHSMLKAAKISSAVIPRFQLRFSEIQLKN